MLKGTTKIELTDVNTGEVETIHEENMITNALSKIFKPLGLVTSGSTMLNTMSPYFQTLLGGILLFDVNIEEDEKNLYPPANARMIGCGSYGIVNDTLGKARGSFNLTESELNLDNRYAKFVYDFATSQGNGVISSVCLTDSIGGLCSYGSEDAVRNSNAPLGLKICDSSLQYVHSSYTGASTIDTTQSVNIGISERLFLIDDENDIAYYFAIDSPTSLRIIKRRAHLKSVSLLTSPYNTKELIEENVIIWEEEIPINYIASNFDVETKALYIFANSSYYIKENAECKMLKISLEDFEVTHYTFLNTSGVRLNTYYYAVFVHKGFVHLITNTEPTECYRFEVGTFANVEKFENKGFTNIVGYPVIGLNGRVYFENSYTSYLFVGNELTKEIMMTENNRVYSYNSSKGYKVQYTPVLNNPMLYFVSYGNNTTAGFVILRNYLATINNLTEPVTKTADKTMKITYTIQEL